MERFFDWRNRLIASPRFQRWATRFPLTRWIVRRQASDIFDLMAGFVYTQVLLACTQVNLFDILAKGAVSFGDLQKQVPLKPAGLRRLLDAAVAIQLLVKRSDDRYALSMKSAPLVGNVAILDMVKHHADFYRDLSDPIALLQGDKSSVALNEYWSYITPEQGAAPENLSAETVADYSKLMAHTQSLVTDEIIDAYPMAKHHIVLDIGGGQGAFIKRLAKRYPHLSFKLFDIPGVAEISNAHFKEIGLSNRAQAIGGNFFQDPLPKGCDLATLVRVIFDHDDVRVRQLLANVFDALNPGGTLLLAEPMAETKGFEAMGHAYFGFYLLAMGRGRPRTEAEISGLLSQAGFTGIKLLNSYMPLNAQVLQCNKPANIS
ncbi:methyltransferase [Polynucleobacter paneuropaeus]|jgi:demethylspheroidene O-methyltransferase|uniref:Methyltransferase n=1 Tax=Polynucleobacter paneuropaeus TaxID=2527775 RepID=A0A2Z4JRA8_9BURK|nr:methyltransferase [Polynucleobacter paneuropaeus]AWW49223.1 methyltransferase [Polynucleobacter paneuropaeus]MBT8560991.1 methyltransferase domain-containing protein [Polynucleobacter paneuropaeus]QWD05252.1 methyltransferase domain-containing protein [Polynucleobacter paneuropaeus]QWD07026.1 methyltransferase domain-containing protein [Polynucleobacter paneuropaeus]